MTRFEGLTDEWILQQLREGAVTTRDLMLAYEREFRNGEEFSGFLITSFKERAYRKLRILEKYGRVERCGMAQLLYTQYMTWRIIE